MAKKQSNSDRSVAATNAGKNIADELLHNKPESKPVVPVRLLYVILALMSFLVYANTLQNGYVMDDIMVIKENTIVSQGIKGIPQLVATPRFYGYLNVADDQYRPVSLCMFAIEYQLFGANPLTGHFFNILVFIGCVIVLFLFVARIAGNKGFVIAFIAALLFAVHPIHTEVVANIKSRDELLCYLFAFLALNLYWDYAKQGRVIQLLLGCGSLFLALLSKETVITFLAIIPLIFFLYCNENRRRSVIITVSAFLAAGLFLLIRMLVLNKCHTATENSTMEFVVNALINAPSMSAKVATEFLVMGKYFLLLFVPYPLICNYSYSSIPFAGFADIGVIVAVLIYGFLFFISIYKLVKNKKDPLAFAILFFLITISLFSNFFFLIGSQMAERFLFFPSTGFCLAMAVLTGTLIKENEEPIFQALKNRKVLIFLVPVFLIFSGMTIARNRDWQSNYRLFKADIAKSPDDIRLNYYYAQSLLQNSQGEGSAGISRDIVKESMGYLNRAITIYPDFAEAHTELGILYNSLKRYDSAEVHYLSALSIQPVSSIATYNLACAYYADGKYLQAIQMFKKTIGFSPGYKLAYLNMARCYMDMQQFDTAIVYFKKILSSDPGILPAQQGIALAYLQVQNYDSAEAHYNCIIQLKPGDLDEINNLGVVYLDAKKYLQAVDVYSKLISIDPNYIVAYGNLGVAYYYLQQYDYAIKYLLTELKNNPQDVSIIPFITKSYRESGKNDSAKIYEAMTK